MSLDHTQKRKLKGRAHKLKSTITVGRAGLSGSIVGMIREALTRTELVKVRIQAESGKQAEAVAQVIARQVPCELVARTGFVALLYSPESAPLPASRQGDSH